MYARGRGSRVDEGVLWGGLKNLIYKFRDVQCYTKWGFKNKEKFQWDRKK